MSSKGWKTYSLQNLCSLITDGKHGDCRNQDNSGYYFLSAKDVSEGRLFYENARQITKEDFEDTHKRTRLEAFDILLTNSGTIGRMAIAADHELTNRTTFQKSVAILKPIKQKVFPRFLYYCLVSRKSDIVNTAGGTTQQNLLLGDLRSFEVEIPEDIETQRRIADILSGLDEKIDLNRQTNATLETFAQGVFKEWFVDFHPVRAKADGHAPVGMDAETAGLFPNKFINTELGEIPANWEVKSIGEIAERIAMGPFGSSIKVETFADEGIPIISGQHLRGFMLEDSTYNFITLEHAEKLKKANVYPGDVIFTHAGNIGNLAFIPEDSEYTRYVVSQRQFFVRCNLEKITPSFITYYFQSPEGQHKLLANSSSVGVPSIAQPVTYLKSIKLPIPPRPILEAFEQIVTPLHRKYRANNRESRTLAVLRDALLPKLMNGEIEV